MRALKNSYYHLYRDSSDTVDPMVTRQILPYFCLNELSEKDATPLLVASVTRLGIFRVGKSAPKVLLF